jgi:hypothetical protein
VLEWLLKVFLAEWELAYCPDLGVLQGKRRGKMLVYLVREDKSSWTWRIWRIVYGKSYGLESLLDLAVEGTTFQGNNWWGRVGIVGNR